LGKVIRSMVVCRSVWKARISFLVHSYRDKQKADDLPNIPLRAIAKAIVYAGSDEICGIDQRVPESSWVRKHSLL